MKNKKLFAILTLVCFMFTLMPVAAFAATDAVLVHVDGVDEDGNVVTGTPDDSATAYVDQNVYVSSESGASYAYFAVDSDGDLEAAATTASYITFDTAGTYKVYALDSTDASNINASIFTKAGRLDAYMDAESLVDDYATVKVKASNINYRIKLEGASGNPTNGYAVSVDANSGWTEKELTATLQKTTVEDPTEADWSAVKSADLTFSTAGYVDITAEDGTTTNRSGEVEFKVTADRAGTYTVYVKYGSKASTKLTVTASNSEAADITLADAPKVPVAIDETVENADIEFKFVEANGYAYDFTATTFDNDDYATTDVKISLTDKPADSAMESDDFYLKKGSDDGDGVYTLGAVSEFDEEGSYTIKVTLKNGNSASVTVKAQEQGDIVGIKYDVYNTPRTVTYGTTTQVNAVLAYDANGVTKNVADYIELAASGAAVAGINNYGYLTIEDNDDYIGSTVTVTAIYDDEFIATTTLTVVDRAAAITYPASNTAEVGVNTSFTGTVIDANGSASSISSSLLKNPEGYEPTYTAVVQSKPSTNAVASVSAEANSKGHIVLNFLASEAGEYEVLVGVTYEEVTYGTDKNGNKIVASSITRYVSGIATITVGAGEGTFEDIVVVSIGADKMIVNSEVVALDVAPFIESGRTMMQFNVLYAFGVDVEWVAETQSIVAEGEGLKVVMQLGSKVATVNGEEVALDVAPQIVNGRTVVPVGFITGLLDITPTFTYNADGTIADILFTK